MKGTKEYECAGGSHFLSFFGQRVGRWADNYEYTVGKNKVENHVLNETTIFFDKVDRLNKLTT